MRTRANNLGLVSPAVLTAVLLAGGPTAHGQQPQQPKTESVPGTQVQRSSTAAPESAAKGKEDDKPGLEDLLTQALKENPDIRVAEAKVNEAEAELNRTRLQVMQKIVTFYPRWKEAREKVTGAERWLEERRKALQEKRGAGGDVDRAEAALKAAKADLASV